jgi:SAM-dependent methyltransferase
MEIGAGDCAVSRALSRHVRAVTAVDVSFAISAGDLPANVERRITDGRVLPAEDGTVDLVYSNQLLEHLHPEDAALHAREIRRVLRPGGRYVCLTPNRLNGPHDVSAHFDDEATGFHLKEYTTRELIGLFTGAGFSGMQVLLKARARTFVLPAAPLVVLEHALDRLPPARRRQVARSVFVRKFLGRVIATA